MTITRAPLTWRTLAACRETDPELFYPTNEQGTLGSACAALAAKRVCAGCDVRRACLDWAMDVQDSFGILGGLSSGQRKGLARAGRPRAGSWEERAVALGMLDPACPREGVAERPGSIASLGSLLECHNLVGV